MSNQMNIGILNVQGDIRSRLGLDYDVANQFEYFFGLMSSPQLLWHYDVKRGEFPDSLDECDAFVISGSPAGVYDEDPWIPKLAEFIKNCDKGKKKLFGICFGHQLIAHVLGGNAEKASKGWEIGLATVSVVHKNIRAHAPWMEGAPATLKLYMSHQDQVTKLPTNGLLLAKNDFCPIQAYTIGSHIFCVQGHPEFEHNYISAQINKIRGKLGDAVYKKALASLEGGTPNNKVVAGWTERFLMRAQ